MNDEAQGLQVESGMDLLIVLLYTPGETGKPGEPIDGVTRLQKLMFLLQQDEGPDELVEQACQYSYRPYKMGPYSEKLQEALEELKSAGIVSTERLQYWLPDDADEPPDGLEPDFDSPKRRRKKVESERFRLSSDLGMAVGRDLWDSLGPVKKRALSRFKSFFNSLSLRQLVIFTYDRYPDYAKESEIKEDLGIG